MSNVAILETLLGQVQKLKRSLIAQIVAVEPYWETDNETRRKLNNGEPITSLASLTRVAVADGRALDRAMYRPSSGLWHSANKGTDVNPRKSLFLRRLRRGKGQSHRTQL